MSFTTDRIRFEGITFDDVLLCPAHSEVLPREASIHATRISVASVRENHPHDVVIAKEAPNYHG